MTRRFTALIVVLVGGVFVPLVAGAAADSPISASVAALFVGEEKTVEGSVAAAERVGNVVQLHLGEGPHAFTVSLIIGLLSNFPATPERYYLGRSIRVVGTIRSFKERPEMEIRDPANIQVIGGSAQPAAGASREAAVAHQPTPPPALGERIDTLTERVRTLEERVERLEHARPAAQE